MSEAADGGGGWNGDLDLRKNAINYQADTDRFGPRATPRLWRRSGTGTAGIDNCRSAGQQAAGVDGGRGRSPGESVGGNDQGGADESLERTEGFCASRVTSSGLSAWSTSVLVSHRDGFRTSSTESGEMAECH